MQPPRASQGFKAVARAKHHQAAGHSRQGQKVDFVLGDEHAAHGRLQGLECGLGDGDVRTPGPTRSGIQPPQTDAQRLVGKAITAGKLAHARGRSVHSHGRQGQVQQLGQHAPVRFGELGVHTGQVHLAQVDAGPGVRLQPCHHGQQAGPGRGQRQGLQGPTCQPGQQHGLVPGGGGHQRGKATGVGGFSYQGQGCVQAVHPGSLGQAVVAHLTVAQRTFFQPVVDCACAQIAGPGAGLGKALRQLAGAGRHEAQPPGEGQRLRLRRLLRNHQRSQQLPLVPALLHLGAQVVRASPGHGRTPGGSEFAASAPAAALSRPGIPQCSGCAAWSCALLRCARIPHSKRRVRWCGFFAAA